MLVSDGNAGEAKPARMNGTRARTSQVTAAAAAAAVAAVKSRRSDRVVIASEERGSPALDGTLGSTSIHQGKRKRERERVVKLLVILLAHLLRSLQTSTLLKPLPDFMSLEKISRVFYR